MKTLIRVGAVTLLALPPILAQAQLRTLSDAAMRATTGQSGLTIEMQTDISIDQIRYTDQGSLNINNVHLSGSDGVSPLDNMTWTLDIAGPGELLNYGFSEVATAAANGTLASSDVSDPNVQWALSNYSSSGGVYGRNYNAGDLVLHLGPTNPNAYTSLSNFNNAIDFGLSIGRIETQGTGSFSGNTTSLFSGINMQGYLGPTDIVIRNGDGSNIALADGTTVSNKYIELNSYFRITNMDLNWDTSDLILIFNFAGVQIRGMTVTSNKTGQFGYANLSAKIGKATSSLGGGTGLALFDVNFQADLNMPQFIMGGTSIGSVKFNDFQIRNTHLIVYGH